MCRLFMTAKRQREPSGKSSSAASARSPKESLPTLVTIGWRKVAALGDDGVCERLAEISDLRMQAKSLRKRFSCS